MAERFERLESHDIPGDFGVSAWRDHARNGEVRYFPIDAKPNEDEAYLNS